MLQLLNMSQSAMGNIIYIYDIYIYIYMIYRLIAGVRKWEHSSPYFIKFKVLSIDQIRDFQIGEFFFRLEHHLFRLYLTIFCLMRMRFTLTILEMPLNFAQLRLVPIYEFTL